MSLAGLKISEIWVAEKKTLITQKSFELEINAAHI